MSQSERDRPKAMVVLVLASPLSDLLWALLWFSLFFAWLGLLIYVGWRLIRLAIRRSDPGWWLLTIALILLTIFLPLIGVAIAGLVVWSEARSANSTVAVAPGQAPPGWYPVEGQQRWWTGTEWAEPVGRGQEGGAPDRPLQQRTNGSS